MQLVIAALVLAAGLVAAALLIGRGRRPAAARRPALSRSRAAWRTSSVTRSTPAASSARSTSAPPTSTAGPRTSTAARTPSRSSAAARRRPADQHLRELERVGSLSAAQARQALLRQVQEDARHEQARILRQVEEETKRQADRRVRSILSVAMQRIAGSHAAETTVSVVQLPSDDMKGRIIGREGRNIRALENLTGVDFIIDDTPNAVVLSAFDGVRREVARLTLEKLLAGRADPPGADRGDVLPGQERARRAHHRARRGGRARGRRRRPRPGAHAAARPPALPHVATGRTCSRTPSSARSSPR